MVVVILCVHSFLSLPVGKDYYCSIKFISVCKLRWCKMRVYMFSDIFLPSVQPTNLWHKNINKYENEKTIHKTSSKCMSESSFCFTYGLTFYRVTLASLLTFFACLAKVVPNHDYGNRQFQNNKTCTFMPLLIGTVYILGQ